jgi:hypothetical protein
MPGGATLAMEKRFQRGLEFQLPRYQIFEFASSERVSVRFAGITIAGHKVPGSVVLSPDRLKHDTYLSCFGMF